jgi:LPS export ABC transporter protein LptC
MLRTRRLPPSLFLAGLLSTAMVLWLAETEQNLRESAPAENDGADYYMENFQLTETDAQGQPIRWLEGSKLAYHNSQNTQLTQPVLTIREQQQDQLWRLSAEQGMIEDTHILQLENQVHIERLDAIKNQRINVVAEDLRIDLTTRKGASSGKVEIQKANSTLQAVGMQLQLDTRQVHLLSEVRGVYAQP